MSSTERAYHNLLAHLRQPQTNASLEAISASVAHYLARLEPSPTPLSASIVDSLFFRAADHAELDALLAAFRHAVHNKHKSTLREPSGVFVPSVRARIDVWAKAVLAGLQGGEPLLRLACASGLLQGVDDIGHDPRLNDLAVRPRVEGEVVLAFASVMDMAYTPYGRQDSMQEALLLASQSLPLVSDERMSVLPLATLATTIPDTIFSSFRSGRFLEALPNSSTRPLTIQPTSPFALTLNAISSSPTFASIARLSKLAARTLTLMADSWPPSAASSSQSDNPWTVMSELLQRLESVTALFEANWRRTPFADVTDENEIDLDSRELLSTTWTILKTVLFSSIMLADAVLSALIYGDHASAPGAKPLREGETAQTELASSVLRALGNLAFVISQFGGIASTAAFRELRKTVYTALDILATDIAESAKFVTEIAAPPSDSTQVEQAKTAYRLVVMEQLVPALSDDILRDVVFPYCAPYLNDPTRRETYESAHSAVLAMFAARGRTKGGEAFTDRLVPFYAECLLDNAPDGRLSTTQLRLAYAALVRGAGAAPAGRGKVMARFCVDALLARVSSSASAVRLSPGERHRLHLVLISLLSSLPVSLLPGTLQQAREVIVAEENGETRRELVGALYEELLEKVGDRGKAVAVREWHETRSVLARVVKERAGDSGVMSSRL